MGRTLRQIRLAVNLAWHKMFGILAGVTPQEARALLAEAVARRDTAKVAWDTTLAQLHDAIREASGVLRQVDIVKATGYTRERIRQINDERPP